MSTMDIYPRCQWCGTEMVPGQFHYCTNTPPWGVPGGKPTTPAYDPGPCPKCGGERRFSYCSGVYKDQNGTWNNKCKPPEHFHVTCTRCGYATTADTMDQEEKP